MEGATGGATSSRGQSATTKTFDNFEQFSKQTRIIHMYQQDISNLNAIDYAFKNNAIFCIKAFVDTLLILQDENQFRNCFDQALLMMIERDLDVKDLVNSPIFYAPIWINKASFS